MEPFFLWVVYARLFMPWDGCGSDRANLANVLAVFAVYAPLIHSVAAPFIAYVYPDIRHTMILIALSLDMLITYAFGAVFSSFLVRHAECVIDMSPTVPHEVGLAATGAVFYLLYELRLRGVRPRVVVVLSLILYAVGVPWAMIHLVSFTLPQVCTAFAIGVFSGASAHFVLGWLLVRQATQKVRAVRRPAGRATTVSSRYEYSSNA